MSPSGDLNENGPHSVTCFQNIRYGLVGGGIPLDVGSGTSQVPPPFSALSVSCVDRQSSQVLLQHRACLPAAMVPTITVINSASTTVNPRSNSLQIGMVIVSYHGNTKVTKIYFNAILWPPTTSSKAVVEIMRTL